MKDLLTLTQWLSPAFPVGAFAFSHGVETRIAEGRMTDAHSLEDWLSDLMQHGSGRSDIVLLSAAYRASDLADLSVQARAFQPSAERLQEAEKLGHAFARTVRKVWNLDVPDTLYPLVVGHAAALRGLPLPETAALYAQAFVANLVSAAVRLVPLGQTEGQAVLDALAAQCEALGHAAPDLTLDDLSSSTFLSDIAAMRHERLEPRVFQS